MKLIQQNFFLCNGESGVKATYNQTERLNKTQACSQVLSSVILEIEEEHYLKIEPDVGEQTLSLNKIALTNR